MDFIQILILMFIILPIIGIIYQLQKNNAEIVRTAMQQIEVNPEDRSLQLHFLSTVTGLYLWSPMHQTVFAKSLNILKENISDTDFQKAFFKYLKNYKCSEVDRRGIYKSVLDMLMVDSTPVVKQFVLEVARWHYTIQRKDGKLTIYDENAIQNDILMHSA